MYGNRTRLKVIQNKVAPPFREVGVESLYGEGLSKCGELVDLAVKHDIIQRSGAWFSMGEARIGQGKETAKQFLQDDSKLTKDIEIQIRAISEAAFRLMDVDKRRAVKGNVAHSKRRPCFCSGP